MAKATFFPKSFMKKLIVFAIVLCLCFVCIFIYSSTYALTNISFKNEKIISEKVPESFDGIKLVYFSDIYYGEFMNEKRFSKMVDEINRSDADIVVFGGDLYSDKVDPNKSNQETLLALLTKIEAPLGKFCVLGDNDIMNEERKQIISNLLFEANFEIITNQALTIHNKNKASINLIGLENYLNGNKDYSNALKNMNTSQFNILVSHCPDIIKSKELNPTHLDLILTGHSLGGQIYVPFINMFQEIKGAIDYNRGTYYIENCELIVSNGLGTSENDIRLFTPPQIHVFHFQTVKEDIVVNESKDHASKEEISDQNDENENSENNESTQIDENMDDLNSDESISNEEISEESNETNDSYSDTNDYENSDDVENTQ